MLLWLSVPNSLLPDPNKLLLSFFFPSPTSTFLLNATPLHRRDTMRGTTALLSVLWTLFLASHFNHVAAATSPPTFLPQVPYPYHKFFASLTALR